MSSSTSFVGGVFLTHPRDPTRRPLTEEEVLAAWEAEGLPKERRRRMRANDQRNKKFLEQHEQELFECFADKTLLIHSGNVVEVFDDYDQAANRKCELDQEASDSAMIRQRPVPFDGYVVL